MSDSGRPHRRQPTRLPRPWDSPGKNTGVGCHFLLQCMKVKSESEVAQSCQVLATPWAAAHQAPPSMGFSRQEYWSGCHCLLHKILIEFLKFFLNNFNLLIFGRAGSSLLLGLFSSCGGWGLLSRCAFSWGGQRLQSVQASVAAAPRL